MKYSVYSITFSRYISCYILWGSVQYFGSLRRLVETGVTCDNVVVMNVTRFCYNAEEGTELSPAQG